jgi:hypothetical protein
MLHPVFSGERMRRVGSQSVLRTIRDFSSYSNLL